MTKMVRSLGLLLAAGLVAGGCCKKPVPQKAPEVPPPAPTPVPQVVKPEPTPAPVVTPPPPAVPGMDEIKGYLKDAFFDFDKYDVRPDQRDAMTANADFLKKWPTVKIKIEGHCDERGTAKYNMGLGERRANAAKDFLVSLGVDASRIETISYGKERPFAEGHDEKAWAQNRRAHFVATAR